MSEEQPAELTRRESLSKERSEAQVVKRKKVLKDRIQAIAILLLVIVLPVTVFFILPTSMGVYDRTHHITMECTVKDIYSESTRTGGLKGGGASGRHIIFDTENCRGHLILQKGVYWDNVDKLTKSLKTGHYEITVGESEWKFEPLYRIFKVAPSIHEYEYLGK